MSLLLPLEPLGQSKPDWVIFQELANRLGAQWNYQHPSEREVTDGTLVRLTSPYGEVEVRALFTDNVSGNEIYLTMNSAEERKAVNRLTSSYHDKPTHTPNYKEMSVRLEALEDDEPPLPGWIHRFGNRQPQIGVKVDEKWSRPGFVPISEMFNGGEFHGESNTRD